MDNRRRICGKFYGSMPLPMNDEWRARAQSPSVDVRPGAVVDGGVYAVGGTLNIAEKCARNGLRSLAQCAAPPSRGADRA
jgi:hypothetical protein